ncbi:MAG: flagellar biosynthesis anti-sigma factor FlgM [Candidatus Schekmanbacteria bacterium]|nr:flagellar biosynthesis anti-sigma factor FlgM [Candidatus Schekmanbacteria bacterium]
MELSPRGREYHGALEEARRAPDVRADRVAAAVESLRRGEGSSREAARKLLDESVDLGS